MAGFDEPQKIVTGLQLLQAGVIDVETADNIDGLENVQKYKNVYVKTKQKLYCLTVYYLGQHEVIFATMAL